VSVINQNNNYSYDEEGRLVKDSSEQISKITWRVDGKVKEIQRGADTSKRFIRFDYDATWGTESQNTFMTIQVLF
jgi:hypothetical protein